VDNNTVLVSVIGTCVTAIGILAYVIRSFIADKPKANGNGNGKEYLKLTDVQDALTIAVQGFRESHLENKMRQEDMVRTLGRIEAHLITCADILKAMPKRNTD
jgi:hypothetical protein